MTGVNSGENLIRKDCYQVFLFVCPANLPFSFAAHPWFVVNRKGAVSRWEVLFSKRQLGTSWGYLSRNSFPIFQGIGIVSFSEKYFWKSTLLSRIEGNEGSLAAEVAEFIEQSPYQYPYRERYALLGPNSNTYVQWVINHFPQSGMHLPWNAIGRNTLQK